MACVDCGQKCSGQRCRDCRASHTKTSKWQYGSEVVLTNGYWHNDNGIMRWRSLS